MPKKSSRTPEERRLVEAANTLNRLGAVLRDFPDLRSRITAIESELRQLAARKAGVPRGRP